MKLDRIIAEGGVAVCRVGLQQRQVFMLPDGTFWEKAICFDDGLSHDEYYQATLPDRLESFREAARERGLL